MFHSDAKSTTGLYHVFKRLAGHQGAILLVTVSDDGKFAASRGSDGTRLWNLHTFEQVLRPTGTGLKGATTSAVWARREDEVDEVLLFGTQTGHLVCWRQSSHSPVTFEETFCQQTSQPSEITGMAYDSAANRLVICNRNAVIQSWAVNNRRLLPIFSVVLEDFVPKGIGFGALQGDRRKILVFGLYDGSLLTLNSENGKVEKTKLLGTMIGNAEVNAVKNVFVIDDAFQGAALYKLEEEACVRTFSIETTKSRRPRQVCFAEDYSVVVSGSDHGIVYIFDRRTGSTLDKLKMSTDWVQTVNAAQVNGVPTIFTVKSTEIPDNKIIVWRKGDRARGHLVIMLEVFN